MKYLFELILIMAVGVVCAQDPILHIETYDDIYSGGSAALKLQNILIQDDDTTRYTLLMDGSDIQSFKADSQTFSGTLFIQAQGGCVDFFDEGEGKAYFNGNVTFGDSVKIGEAIQTTASSEIAFGTIRSAGTIHSGSGNYSVDRVGSRYEIEINDEGYHYLDYTTLITPISFSVYSFYTTSLNGKLIVYLRDADGENTSGDFQFVTHKYVSGDGKMLTNCGSEPEDMIALKKHKEASRR